MQIPAQKASSPYLGGPDCSYLLSSRFAGSRCCTTLVCKGSVLSDWSRAPPITPHQSRDGHSRRIKGAIVLDAESRSDVAACGLGADSGVCCSRAGSTRGSRLLPLGILEVAIPQLPKPRGPPAGAKLTGKRQMQEGLEGEPELRVIQASSKKREIPIFPGRTLDAQSTKACTCTYMLRTGMADGGKVSLFSLSWSRNLPAEQLWASEPQPVTCLCIYPFNPPLSACLFLI